MTPKDWLEFVSTLGPWVSLALAPPVLAALLIWKLRDRIRQRLRWWSRPRVAAVKAVSVLVLILYYCGLSYVYYSRGLPRRFEDGVIGILIAAVSSSEEQQLYQQTIRAALSGVPELDSKVAVALLKRELPQDEEEAHQAALELGRRVNAAFVLRAVRVGIGETIQHQVWLTVVDQPVLRTRGGRLDMGLVSQGDLIELEKLRLPNDVALLARCVLAMTLFRAEEHRQAAEHFAAILDEPEVAGAPERFDLWMAHGGAQVQNGDYQAAAASFREALRLRNDAACLHNLAAALVLAGRYKEAEPLQQRALATYEEALGPNHPDTATNLNSLASLYHHQSRFEEAEPLYQRAIAIREKALGPDHPDTGGTLNGLAGLYRDLARYEEAEPLYLRALAIAEKALGLDHPSTATALNDLAGLYEEQGGYQEAEPLYQRALTIVEDTLGPKHPNTATSVSNLALLCYRQGRYDEAEPLMKRALAIREEKLGPEHPATATSLSNLAALYRAQGRDDEAESLYQRTLAIFEREFGPEHPDTATALNNLAGLYQKKGRYDEAEPLYRRALAIFENALGAEHPATATALNNLAGLDAAQGRYDDAEQSYRRALAVREEVLGRQHPETVQALSNLALSLRRIGREAEAARLEAEGK